MNDFQQNEILEYLSEIGIANVQNGLIHSLAVWLDEHIVGNNVRQRKQVAFNTFAKSVLDTVKKRTISRKVWAENKPLPHPYNDSEVLDNISHQVLIAINDMSFEEGLFFIAELWGKWILVCPRIIVESSPEFGDRAAQLKGEIEFSEYMFLYLDMVYGNMG